MLSVKWAPQSASVVYHLAKASRVADSCKLDAREAVTSHGPIVGRIQGSRTGRELARWTLGAWKGKTSVQRYRRCLNLDDRNGGRSRQLVATLRPARRDANLEDKAIAVLDLAESIAVEAGGLIQRKCGRATQVDSKAVRADLVTEVDREVEALIRRRVQGAFPLHHLLGEESATEEELARLDGTAGEDEWTWVVDPIDGTLNFVGGMPFCTVSIGVVRAGMVEVGVVYDPFRDELFSAKFGDGACLNGRPLPKLPQDTELADAAISVGFPSQPASRAAMLLAISAVAPHARTVRALGSAALHMSYVAAGRLGAFFEHDLQPWDVAAARLIVQEAGGLVTNMDGEELPLTGGSVLATSGSIHQGILELLKNEN